MGVARLSEASEQNYPRRCTNIEGKREFVSSPCLRMIEVESDINLAVQTK